MKHLSAFFAAAGLFLGAAVVHAQADPTAKRSGALQVGATYSNANSDEVFKRIGGASIYATFDLFRHLGVEADVHRVQPYIKALGGSGKTVAQESYVEYTEPNTPGTFGAYSLGAGLDYRLSRSINIRAINFEQQLWPGFTPNGLSPRIISFGAAYRFR